MLLLGVVISVWAARGVPAPVERAPDRRPVRTDSAALPEPGITMHGLSAEMTIDGSVEQRVKADWGRLDPARGVVDLANLTMEFYRDDAKIGTASSGAGRLWMREQQGVAERNDVLLTQTGGRPVQFDSPGNDIKSSSIKYFNSRGIIRSGKYERYFSFGPYRYRSVGQSLEITIGADLKLRNVAENLAHWEYIGRAEGNES